MRTKSLFAIGILSISPTLLFGRDYIDCGGVEVISVKLKDGAIAGKWTTPGLGVEAEPFLLSPDQKAVYVGFETCRKEGGEIVNNDVLSENGSLTGSSIGLLVPNLSPEKPKYPDPKWTRALSPLPSSDNDAVVNWGNMIFFDKSEASPILKIINLQYRPILHTVTPPWKGQTAVRDLIAGSHHVFVFSEERTLYCYDLAGNLLWNWSHDGPKDEAGPGVKIQIYEDGSRYLVAVNHAGLYSIDAATGKVSWRLKYHNIYNSPSIIKAGEFLILGPVRHY